MAASFPHAKPLGKLSCEMSSFTDEKSKHQSHINGQLFSCAVDVMMPEIATIPEDLEICLTENQTFYASNVPVSLLVNKNFIEGFVKRGKLYALSQGTNIDSHDCLAFLPSGELILHLCKDTYQELGLEGTPSEYHKKDYMKYVVKINLVNPPFVPGKKSHDRIQWCLNERLDLYFDLLLSWQPEDPKVCSSSIQNFFKMNNVQCNRTEVAKRFRKYQRLTTPVISPDLPVPFTSPGREEESCHYMEIFEWLGAYATEVDLSCGGPDSYVSSYTCPVPNRELSHAVACQFTGMFTTEAVQTALDTIRKYTVSRNLPWCSLTVHGFIDSPVTNVHNEHGFYNTGDNLYTFLIFPDQKYWLYTALGGRDVCS